MAEMTLDGPQVRSLAEVVGTYDRVAIARLALDDDCKHALMAQIQSQLAQPIEFAKADAAVAGVLALGVRTGAMGESEAVPDDAEEAIAAAMCSTWILRALDSVCSDCRPRISWPSSTGRFVLPGHLWASDDVRAIIDLR